MKKQFNFSEYLNQSRTGKEAACSLLLRYATQTTRFFCTPVLERLPEESFYRLLVFCYLPESIERCLYLDPDIYVRKSLIPLYTMELGDSYRITHPAKQ